MGGTLGGAWGSVLHCSMGSCIAAQVRLVGGVVVGVGAPVSDYMLASCCIAYMVWLPKRVKGAANAGFARASARRLATSVAAPAEDMVVSKNCTVLVMRPPCVSGM